MRRAALAAGLVLVIAGCGGDDGGGAGDGEDARRAYASAVNGFCSEVASSVERVQGDLEMATKDVGTDVDAAAKAVGGALTGFATDIQTSVKGLQGAEVPDEYRAFHDRAVGGLTKVVTALMGAGDRAAEGDVTALAQLGSTLNDIEVPDPPAELRRAAPACQELSRRRAG